MGEGGGLRRGGMGGLRGERGREGEGGGGERSERMIAIYSPCQLGSWHKSARDRIDDERLAITRVAAMQVLLHACTEAQGKHNKHIWLREMQARHHNMACGDAQTFPKKSNGIPTEFQYPCFVKNCGLAGYIMKQNEIPTQSSNGIPTKFQRDRGQP